MHWVRLFDSNSKLELDIENAIFCPDLVCNLLSERRLLIVGFRFNEKKTKLYLPGTENHDEASRPHLEIVWSNDGLFHIFLSPNVTDIVNGLLEHYRIGHKSYEPTCLDCPEIFSKKNLGAKVFEFRSKIVDEVTGTDLAGPVEVRSIGGSVYLQLFVEAVTREYTCYGVKSKHATETSKNLIKYSEKRPGIIGQGLRADNGTEFDGKFKQVATRELKMNFRRTARYSPW